MPPLVPVRSLPLFAFANDGTIAWLRATGSTITAVDARTGAVLRELALDPAPFGISWTIERVGRFFVVKDDRELSAYDGESGTRLWKRTGPTRVAFAGANGDRHVTIAPGPAGVEILEADLATGELSPRLGVDGTMDYIGPHGTRAGDLLVFATDQRDVFAVDTTRWRVVARHSFPGSHALPPIASASGVHVAIVERHRAGALTRIATLDRTTGALVSTHELPGTAHAVSAGTSGLVLDVKRSGVLERVAFRPQAPHIRLAIAKNVDVSTAFPEDLLSPRAPRPPLVEIVPAPRPRSSRPEMLPAPRTDDDARPESARDGFLTLLEVMRARSEMLARIAETFGERPADVVCMHDVGLRFRDPRARWSARPGRDPCLVDLAIDGGGNTLATYWYPPAKARRLPVVRVDGATGDARWLADDFDAWLAGFLHGARTRTPAAAARVLDVLGLAADFPRLPPATLPPPWFFEAHGTRWTLLDVEEAMAAGDGVGAERMLVALGRAGYAAQVKEQLVEIYGTFGWGHHRAVVTETW